MSAAGSEILQKVGQWLGYGDEDLRLARHALTITSGCPYRLIAYHAQQCAEKYLKAYLVFKGVDFPYTHNISRLLELCNEHGGWAETLQDAEELTPFAITARYPGIEEEVTKEEALRAIEIASCVRQRVRAVLLQEGMNLPEESEL
jgi:HEPN domain-containing protein